MNIDTVQNIGLVGLAVLGAGTCFIAARMAKHCERMAKDQARMAAAVAEMATAVQESAKVRAAEMRAFERAISGQAQREKP